MHRRATWFIAICGVLAAVLTGCGKSKLEVAPVHGRVTFNGKPVPGGEIQFIPVAGGTKVPVTARATIDENGNYTLSTYGKGDGAILGEHRVVFSKPALEDAKEELEAAEQEGDDPGDVADLKANLELAKKLEKLGRVEPEPGEVTVVTGDNEFNITLVKDDEDEGDEEDEDDDD